jgi:hypothetical protein
VLVTATTITLGLFGSFVRPAQATIGTGYLVGSSPANGSRSAFAPSQVQLQFSLLPLLGTRITVSGPYGVVTSAVPFLLGTTATESLPGQLPDGDYAVQYYADFGLLGSTAGTVYFAVGPAPAPSTSTPQRGSTPSGMTSGMTSSVPATRPAAKPRTSSRGPSSRGLSSPAAAAAGPGGPGTPSPVPTVPGGKGSAATDTARTVPVPARGADLVALGDTRPVASGSTSPSSGGWPLPPPLVLVGLLLAATAFAADRWRTTRRDRAQLRRAATGSPATP